MTKNRMSTISRTTEDLINSLQEQCGFLKKSNALYDEGDCSEAKRIAQSLRILLHDSKNSHSILGQLTVKDTLGFPDTDRPYNENNLAASVCLTMIRITNQDDMVLPLLNQFGIKQRQNFMHWWEQIVLDDKKHKFSRANLILLVANKDGGARVDPDLPIKYHALTRGNSVGMSVSCNGIERPLQNFCFASIRQIGFEIESLLESSRVDLWRH